MASDPGHEWVDVIDDEGNVVSTVRRAEMRGRRLPHRCTYILVFNRKGELFIHQRTPTKDVFPSYWDVCVGGVLAAGEPFAAGARRELAEEIGLEASPVELFLHRYADEHSVVQGMVYCALSEGPFRLQPEEIVQGEFLSVSQVKQRAEHQPFCPDGLAVLAEYQRRFAAPVVYTVTATFPNDALAAEWLTWLRERHIAQVLAGGATDAEIVEREGEVRTFEVRYHFPSRLAFAVYEQDHAPGLRAEGLQRFSPERGVTYRRSVGLVRPWTA